MISATSEKGFFAAHWDWLVAAGGIIALVAGAAFLVFEKSHDADLLARETSDEAAAVSKRTDTGVEKVDMVPFDIVLKENESPSKIVEPAETAGSFLASEKRVFCEQGDDPEHKSCGRPMPATSEADLKVCPFCKTKQPEEKKQDLDSDGDGISDEWEVAHGMNPNDPADIDGDLDGDGYTNIEEYEAGTDPQDPASHPDDLDSLKIELPLVQEKLHFYLEKDKSVPYNGSWMLYFRNDAKKTGYGTKGMSFSVTIGKEIVDGDNVYVLKEFEKKSEQKSIKGGKGMGRPVDVSEATIVRKKDQKVVRLVAGVKNTPVETKVKLVFTRGQQQSNLVSAGEEFSLNGTKYKVLEINSTSAESASVMLKNTETGKTRNIVAP